MAAVSPLLIIVVIVVVIVTLVLIVLVIQSRRTTTTTTSTLSGSNCTGTLFAPPTLTIINPAADILTLSWSPVVGATEYAAYIATTPNFTENQAVQTRTTKSSAISFGNLALGVTYYGKVKATNSCGASGFSPESSYTLIYVYPTRFILVPSNFPSHHACDNHSSVFAPDDMVGGSIFCSDTDQFMFHVSSDNTFRQSTRPGYCLTRDNDLIYFRPCAGAPSQQWSYRTLDSSLCSVSDPNGGCLQLPAGFNASNYAVALRYGGKTDPSLYEWNLNAI